MKGVTMDITAIAGLIAKIQAAAIIISLVVIGIYVLNAIANYKIFKKAGEAGWKAWIPFYNLYIMFKITWKLTFFWVEMGIAVATGILSGVVSNNVESGNPSAGLIIALAAIMILLDLALAVIKFIALINESKAFGHGIGFTLGLFFLNTIFTWILGFGKSQYVGPMGIPAAAPAGTENTQTAPGTES